MYRDSIFYLQLKHSNWEENPTIFFYSNYIHVVLSNGTDTISLSDDQEVKRGDLIAYSNRTASLEHIHFEIRVGNLFQANACNPWKYLPNDANDYSSFEATLSLTPNYNGIDCEAVVNVSVPPDQLMFTRVELHIIDNNDEAQEVRFFDMCGANSNHTLDEMDDWEYRDDPSDSSSYVIRISPERFNSQSFEKGESAGYGFVFIDLPPLSGSGRVMAKIFDVFDNSLQTDYVMYTCSSDTPVDTTDPSCDSNTDCDPDTPDDGSGDDPNISGDNDNDNSSTSVTVFSFSGAISLIIAYILQ